MKNIFAFLILPISIILMMMTVLVMIWYGYIISPHLHMEKLSLLQRIVAGSIGTICGGYVIYLQAKCIEYWHKFC